MLVLGRSNLTNRMEFIWFAFDDKDLPNTIAHRRPKSVVTGNSTKQSPKLHLAQTCACRGESVRAQTSERSLPYLLLAHRKDRSHRVGTSSNEDSRRRKSPSRRSRSPGNVAITMIAGPNGYFLPSGSSFPSIDNIISSVADFMRTRFQ